MNAEPPVGPSSTHTMPPIASTDAAHDVQAEPDAPLPVGPWPATDRVAIEDPLAVVAFDAVALVGDRREHALTRVLHRHFDR